ncbi:MAG TPA: septum formation initiator family protein [Candidatus Saccharimonadales bacterium]|nr:septum formation initiator family protein [Candidatus Saccharimonadales bacterium]
MKKAAFVIAVIISLVIINNLVRSIYDVWKKQDLVVSAQNQLEKEKAENQMLKQQLSTVQSATFVEQQARDKLFMAKPGESQLIIPQGFFKTQEQKKQDSRPNWKKWLSLFF